MVSSHGVTLGNYVFFTAVTTRKQSSASASRSQETTLFIINNIIVIQPLNNAAKIKAISPLEPRFSSLSDNLIVLIKTQAELLQSQ